MVFQAETQAKIVLLNWAPVDEHRQDGAAAQGEGAHRLLPRQPQEGVHRRRVAQRHAVGQPQVLEVDHLHGVR